MNDSRFSRGGYALVDQSKKLIFLIEQRGDRRPPDATNPMQTSKKWLVNSQATLAGALGVGPDRVNKWIKVSQAINLTYLREICRIFAVDLEHLIQWEFERFKAKYAQERSGWGSLVANLKPKQAEISIRPPWTDAQTSTRQLTFDMAGPPRTKILAGTPFWCFVRTPVAADGRRIWAGWHAFFFNLDCQTDDAMSLYRPLLDRYGKGTGLFPTTGDLIFPWEDPDKSPIMRAGTDDIGKDYMLICLLVAPHSCDELLEAAKREATSHATLLRLINMSIDREKAAIAIAPYRVVEFY